MKLLALLACGMMVYGCATEGPRVVKYRYVAYSWTDGNIDDMIEAWGKPNRGFRKASKDEPGFARWRVFSRISGGAGSGGGYYKDLDSMLRPGVAPPPGAT